MIREEELSQRVIGCVIEVHKHLGPGLLESAYQICARHELTLHGLRVRHQIDLPVIYKGVELDCGYRMDLIVEDKILLELKAVETVTPVHEAQLLSYTRLSGLHIGLLVNFHELRLVNGITRRVL
jgi:GxxExxY protein